MTTNHISRLSKGAVGAFASRCLALALGFLSVIVVTRVLGKEQFGIFSSAISLLGVLGTAVILGIPQMLVRYLSSYMSTQNYDLANGLLSWSFRRLALISIMLGALFCAVALLSTQGFFGDWGKMSKSRLWIYLFVAAAVPLHAVGTYRQAVLQAMKRPVLALAGMQLVRPLVFLLGVWLLGQSSVNTSAATAGAVFLAGATLAYLLSSHWQAKSTPLQLQGSKAEHSPKEWWGTALPLGWIGLAIVLIGSADPAMLDALVGPIESGRFDVASRVAALIPFALSAVNVVVAPMISELFSTKKLDELQQVLTWASRGILAYTIPTALFLWLAAPWYLNFFGQPGEYQDAREPLQWLIAGQVFI